MPLPLSSVAIEEKNKLGTDSVFLVLLEISIPGLTDRVRVVHNSEDVVWRGESWVAFPFKMEEISESSTGEVPRVEIRVGNVNRVMELYIHEYDRYCKTNGYSPITCRIYVVNSLNLASDDPEVEHVFDLMQPKTSPLWATFVLGASNPFNQRYPLRRMLPVCEWRFKDKRCLYSGAAGTCNQSFARCVQLANTRRFGGFYGTGR